MGASLGSLRGVLSMLLSVVAGVAGVPWFSKEESGFALTSFGYILGFVIAAYIVGQLAESGATHNVLRTAGLMVVGDLAIYFVGVTWLKFAIDVTWVEAFTLHVLPFLLGDVIKIAAAAGLLPGVWRLLQGR